MAYVSSFDDISDIFGSEYSAQTSFDPFSASDSDTDRTGLENDLDQLHQHDPSQPDSDFSDEFEDLDDDDVEVGEDIDEEDNINEVDNDFDDITEPDFNPEDDEPINQDPTDISHEDGDEVEVDDAPHDQFDETSPQDEISQDDDIIQDDSISQLEETGFDEPIFYPDDEDNDRDPTDDALEEILYAQERDDITNDILDAIGVEGEQLEEARQWIEEILETFLDFTDQDVSSHHDDVWTGFEITDGYDPPNPFEDDGVMLFELDNLVDDVFNDVFPDPISEPFMFFDEGVI